MGRVTATIYALTCPDTSEVRYVGKSNNLAKRLGQHLRESRRGGTAPRHQWMRRLLRNGKEPGHRVLEECSQEDWPARERAWISRYRKRGVDLLNRTAGGESVAQKPPVMRLVHQMRNRFGSNSEATKVFEKWVHLSSLAPEVWGDHLNGRAEELLGLIESRG